jgi:uncharacterized membrane protein
MQYLVAYAASAIVFFGLDLLWLGVIARNFYRDHLGHLLRDQPDLAVSGVFYVAYVGGIVLFAISPALQGQSWVTALLLGILLGVIAYGTYDMTNLATLRGWPVALSVVDVIWGSALTGLSATAGYLAARWAGAGGLSAADTDAHRFSPGSRPGQPPRCPASGSPSVWPAALRTRAHRIG